jgi:hypothetical protein
MKTPARANNGGGDRDAHNRRSRKATPCWVSQSKAVHSLLNTLSETRDRLPNHPPGGLGVETEKMYQVTAAGWMYCPDERLHNLISFFALIVAGFSFFVASERFRLDLYNKRYDIYVRTVKFYWVLLRSEEAAAQLGNFEQLRAEFILASRESGFLFPHESGVPQLLDRLNNASFTITGSRDMAKGLPPNIIIENQKQFGEAIRLWNESLVPLESLMAPYLNYHYASTMSALIDQLRQWWHRVRQHNQRPK